jgi:hypothetical protein
MIRARDVNWMEIEQAKKFIREPLSEGFKAWSTLRDRDNVTMTIQELGHLMAWYAAIRIEAEQPKEQVLKLDPPLPEPSDRERLFFSTPLQLSEGEENA